MSSGKMAKRVRLEARLKLSLLSFASFLRFLPSLPISRIQGNSWVFFHHQSSALDLFFLTALNMHGRMEAMVAAFWPGG